MTLTPQQRIAYAAKLNPLRILLQFSLEPDKDIPKYEQEQMIEAATDPGNWENITDSEDKCLVFICTPFEDQLKAYVNGDSIEITGE